MGFRRSRWEPDIRTIPGLWSFQEVYVFVGNVTKFGGGEQRKTHPVLTTVGWTGLVLFTGRRSPLIMEHYSRIRTVGRGAYG